MKRLLAEVLEDRLNRLLKGSPVLFQSFPRGASVSAHELRQEVLHRLLVVRRGKPEGQETEN